MKDSITQACIALPTLWPAKARRDYFEAAKAFLDAPSPAPCPSWFADWLSFSEYKSFEDAKRNYVFGPDTVFDETRWTISNTRLFDYNLAAFLGRAVMQRHCLAAPLIIEVGQGMTTRENATDNSFGGLIVKVTAEEEYYVTTEQIRHGLDPTGGEPCDLVATLFRLGIARAPQGHSPQDIFEKVLREYMSSAPDSADSKAPSC